MIRLDKLILSAHPSSESVENVENSNHKHREPSTAKLTLRQEVKVGLKADSWENDEGDEEAEEYLRCHGEYTFVDEHRAVK